MNIPGTYQSIPTIPEIISISATLSSGNGVIGSTIKDAEKKLGARIVMIEKENDDGILNILTPNQVEVLEDSDKIYLFLNKSDIKRVERSLED
tara:strand:- start:884 stop:1162 length:279 start_codon:yes stop_codon:yes gene_type:complete